MAVALSDIDVDSAEPKAVAIAKPKRKARIVVSLDAPTLSSSSSSSDDPGWATIMAADAVLGPMPGVSFASIYAGQMALKRELDRTVSHTQSMQLQIDHMNTEISDLKRRRL